MTRTRGRAFLPPGRALRRLLPVLWLLILLGLLLRLWWAPTAPGRYDIDIDTYLYLGQRLLEGHPMYLEGFNAKWPLIQVLFAPAAWLGSIRAHRVLILLVNLAGGAAIAGGVRALGRAGWLSPGPMPLLPLASGVLFVVMSQKMVGGLSGHLHQFSNVFLAVALLLLARQAEPLAAGPRSPEPTPPRRAALAGAGACLMAALAVRPNLLYPVALVGGALMLILRPWREGRGRGGMVLLGAGALALLGAIVLPYAFLPDGLARFWAGAFLLPLEWSAQRPPDPSEATSLGELLRRLGNAQVAGLPLWLLLPVPLLGVARLLRRAWTAPGPESRRLLRLPSLCLLALGALVLAFARHHFWGHYVLLLVIPVVLLVAAGLAALASPAPPAPNRCRPLAQGFTWVVTLVVLYNVPVVEVQTALRERTRPSDPADPAAALDRDRDRVLAYLGALPAGERGFLSPQDFSYHWRLRQRASTVGVHPSWSLEPYGMRRSWATDRLGLAIRPDQACAQLTAAGNRHLVWTLTTRGGRHTLDFLRHCLVAGGEPWRDISGEIGLETERIRVFRRLAAPRTERQP